MIERITYGERKTHKLTFLFLFFYCHFYFAVTFKILNPSNVKDDTGQQSAFSLEISHQNHKSKTTNLHH